MAHLFKWLLALLLLPLVVAFALEALFMLGAEVTLAEVSLITVGFVSYLILYPFVFSRNVHFLEVFEHELGHTVLNLLWWRTLTEFRVNPEENQSHVKARGNSSFWWLTALAPYYLPLFTLPWLVLRPLFNPAFYPLVDVAIGLTLAFHVVALLKEFGLHQTDIQPYTLPLAFLITLFFNCIFIVLIITFAIERSELFGLYLGRAYLRTVVYYDDSWFLVNELWREFTGSPYR